MRRLQPPSWPALAGLLSVLALAGCGGSLGSGASASTRPHAATSRPGASRVSVTTTHTTPKRPPPPPRPELTAAASGSGPTPFVPALRWRGQTAVWIARSPGGVTLMSFNQQLVALHLHSGTIDAGTLGWRYGPSIGGLERARLAAAFNGGFRLSTGAGGLESYGRVGSPLRAGLGSIVTYSDGSTDIGSWHQEVPTAGKQVVSVRQNLTLLIDHGATSATTGCQSCWGATLGGVPDPARSALGITADGRLIWAGGEYLTATDLAAALQAARVVRAVELDINPEWVAGYLYAHHGSGAVIPVPAVAGQHGIPGEYLAPWSRDFFSLTVR